MLRLVRLAVVLAIVVFWLHTLQEALQLDRESTPRDLRVGRSPYEILLARSLLRDPVQYLGIYQGDRRVGYARTEVRQANTRYLIRNRTVFAPHLLTLSLPTEAEAQIRVGPDFRIEHFRCDVVLAGSQFRSRFEGVVEGDDLVVTAWMPATPGPQTHRVSRELTLFNGLSPFVGVPRLEVGEAWTIQGLDVSSLSGGGLGAASLRPRVLTARILRRETILREGKPVETWVAALDEDPADPLKRRAQAWIDAEGTVVQEEHRVLSWTFLFRRETPPDRPAWAPWH